MSSTEIPQSIGRYEILGRLGRGGMGMVFRARDPQIGRQVAIKLLHVADDPRLRDRFLQEAQSAGSLKHPNIVTIYDFGDHEGSPYIVMEFVEGVTLGDEISRREWPLSKRLELIESLADGLDYAHGRGIVHRDVKPANLMLDRDGVLKILDFGIARVSNSGLTQVGMLMGTPHYMSPEQIEGRAVDRRSDIFAVGVVMYELLGGRKAFAGDTAAVVMTRILREPPVPLEQIAPDLDPELIAIVERALRKAPERRYQTLAELAVDIRRVHSRLESDDADALERSTVHLVMPVDVTPRPTPRRMDRDAIAKLRAERIESLLGQAQDAFDAGDFEGAASACEQAAVINPDDRRVLDLLTRASAAQTRREAGDALTEAREHLNRGDFAKARELLAQALTLDPSAPEVRKFQADLEQRERQREQSAVALAAARKLLDGGEIEGAIRAASDILLGDPGYEDARELTRTAVAALEARRKREREAQIAANLVEDQRRHFRAGRRKEAIAALQAATPTHEIIAAGIAELRAELAAIEQREGEERERQHRARAEAEDKRQRDIAAAMDRANRAIAASQYAEAKAALDAVLALDPHHRDAQTRYREVEKLTARQRQAADTVLEKRREPDVPAPPIEPAGGTRPAEWKMALASLPVVAAILGGGIWWLTHDTTDDSGGATSTVPAATTTISAATTTVGGEKGGPSRPIDLIRAVAAADALRSNGNLRGAARDAERALAKWPNDPELIALANQIASEAAGTADRAKKAADGSAEATQRAEYRQAVSLLASAGQSRGARRLQRATDEYLTAAQLFADSMKIGQLTKLLTTTSIPIALPTTAPSSSSSTSTVQSSVPTTSIQPTMSNAQATQLLSRYSAAYAEWNVPALRALFPGMPRDYEQALNLERKAFRSCVHTFGNVQVSGTLAQPRIEADAVKTCAYATRRDPELFKNHHIFDLQRQPDGSFIIVRHART